jgi:4-amino-4-deoxy-L-arabinose transferase-like glycosyltransferase
MADSFAEKPIYLEKPSLLSLIRSRLALRERWLPLVVPVTVFLVALLPRLLSLRVFITADEDDQIMFATHFLKSALQGNWSGALVLGYPGIPTLILGAIGVAARYLFHYTGWLPLPWVTADFMTTLEQVTARFGVFSHPLDFLGWVRTPLALAAALSILGIYLLARQLVEERLALVGTLILAFDPFILAHSRIIHVDAPLSYFMFLSFLAFLLYLRQGGWRRLLLSGLFGGLAVLSKTPAVLLGPILVATGLVYTLFSPPAVARSERWKRLATALIIWGVIAVAAVFIFWPSMWSRPLFIIQALIRNVTSVNSGFHPTTGIFWEEQQTDKNPFYYLRVIPFHLTPLSTFGIVAGLFLIPTALFVYWRKANNWLTDILPLALSLIGYVTIFMMPVSAIARRGDRYILPTFFALDLLAALGLWGLMLLAQRYFNTIKSAFRLAPAYLLGGALAVQILLTLLYHPYYLAYYNPALQGAEIAPRSLNVGWGEGLDQAARYLNELHPQEPSQVAAWYSAQFAPYYLGSTIDLSNQEAALTADYAVFYINQVQRGFPSGEILNYFRQREPLHVVELGGIEYAWIYKGPIIGQKPETNFTVPVEAVLGGGAKLYGVDIPVTEAPANRFAGSHQKHNDAPYLGYGEKLEGLPVTLYWETVGAIQTNHGKTNVYIRLMDEQGNTWGQVDRLILAGLWRTNSWHPGYYLRDEYKLPIEPGTPAGQYHLEVGLYDFETGQNYGIVKNIGQVTLTPPEKLPELETLDLKHQVLSPINEALTLIGHDYSDISLPPGAEVAGKIFWKATGAIDQGYEVEFSFLDGDRKKYIIAEAPLLPSYPPNQWQPQEIVGAAYRFRVPALAPSGHYPIMIALIDPKTGAAVGQPLTLAQITVEALERNFQLPDQVVPISAVINNEIELVGYRLHNQTVKAKKTFGLTLYWRSLNIPTNNYTVFVHAVGPDQNIRGQWDSTPVGGAYPTSGWLPGEIVEDHYDVLMGRDVPPWKYDIFVGMYDSLTGARLPLISLKAPISDNRVWLTRVQAETAP